MAIGAIALVTVVTSGLAHEPANAMAEPVADAAVVLGVDSDTVVELGPETGVDAKFATVDATVAPVAVGLIAPATKRVAALNPRRPGRPARHYGGPSLVCGKWRKARVSWYGPGFYGHGMAGGGKLRRNSMVVAHRSLPFGTRILFRYKGRSVVAVVRDRGPYVSGRKFDLGPGTAKALHFRGVGRVRYRILR